MLTHLVDVTSLGATAKDVAYKIRPKVKVSFTVMMGDGHNYKFSHRLLKSELYNKSSCTDLIVW